MTPKLEAARPYFPSLDGLRCLAIVPIVWHHSTTHPLEGVLGRGPLGVDLFFALSGFLITSLLLHERRTSSAGIALGRFWVRRSLRIFPLYYLVLGAFVLHAIFVRSPGPARDHFLGSVPYYATYTSNWFLYEPVDHPIVFAFAWSLATEEQFYVLWPPILRFGRGRLLPGVVMAAFVVVDQLAERGVLTPLLGEGLGLVIPRSFATPIGIGALAALAVDTPSLARPIDAVFGHRWSSVLALSFVAVALVRPWPLFPTHLALTALVVACARRRDHVLAPLFENAIVGHVGTVSYGIYLLNVPIVTAVRGIAGKDAGTPFVFVGSLAASVLIATVSYRVLELPLLRLRDRFRSKTLIKYT